MLERQKIQLLRTADARAMFKNSADFDCLDMLKIRINVTKDWEGLLQYGTCSFNVANDKAACLRTQIYNVMLMNFTICSNKSITFSCFISAKLDV